MTALLVTSTGIAVAAQSTEDPGPSRPPTPSPSATVPPEDREASPVRLARPTWDTGWFQAEIHRELLMRLGHRVEGPTTMENEEFYRQVASGDVDLWASGWFPLHDSLLQPGAEPVGTQVEAGALQGYFVDETTAAEHGITHLTDLADPGIASQFDVDGNGRADLVGCNLAWACGPVVDHHLEAFGLADTVEQVQADYSPLMLDTVDRYEAGEPVLFYTFTPNWTVGELVPGQDVRWLQAPGAALPNQPGAPDELTEVAGLDGCADDPCQTGWPPNDIRAVANEDFLAEHPAVRTLLQQVSIPLEDILDQNARMIAGEGGPDDIRQHARDWLADNAATVDEWVRTADPDAVAVDGDTATGESGGEPLRVAVRTLEPFVIYERRTYTGYSVELAEELGVRMGRPVEVYGVNTVAKQLDDVARGAADLAVAGIAITSDREAMIDFSLPVFQTGLGILVPTETGSGLMDRARALGGAIFTSELPWMVLAFLLVLLLSAHMIWWFERRHNPDFADLYGQGIWDSFWWATVTVTTVGYGDKAPKGNAGRGFALLWMIVGYFVFAAFTASITSSLAVSELRGSIAGPSDLAGHRVATVSNSAAEDWLITEGVGPIGHGRIEDAYGALGDGDVDAVVFDAPVLQYHAARRGRGEVRTVGPVFDEVRYGVAIHDDEDDLREQVNLALLDLIETGAFQQLQDRWFEGD